MDDRALYGAWQNGSEDAFGVLYERYFHRVTAYAWRMLRSEQGAEEVAVDAFCRIIEGRYRPTGSFRAFLFTTVQRLCLDRQRRQRRAQRAWGVLSRSPDPPARTPEQSAIHNEQLRALEAAVGGIPEEHRATLLLYYGQQLTSVEVAQIIGCRPDQVRSRLSYARKLLRRALQKEGP